MVSAEVALHHSAGHAPAAGLWVGVAAGLVNHVTATLLRINPLMTTLAMSFVLEGLGNRLTHDSLVVLSTHPHFGKIADPSHPWSATTSPRT